jgi:polyketide biosynthesis enoyl-CoA hydratase PksH
MDPVLIQQESTLVRAVLNRPDEGNTLRPEIIQALHEAVDAAERDPSCRALVIESSGAQFCLGLDLAYARLAEEWHEGGAQDQYWRLINRLRTAPVVTVAVVDGPAVGGGVGLACACDFVVVGSAATFRLTEVLLGLLPGMIMPGIARRIGEQRVFRMAMLTELLDADEAIRIGLADLAAERGADALRGVLVAVRRLDRDTVAALKSCRDTLFPTSDEYGEYAGRLLGRRLDDPAVRQRIDRLRLEGMLR